MTPLLVFAMQEESQDVFPDYNVLHTQIGKVNAAHALMKHVAIERPQLVINLGTAGSRKHAGGTIVNPTQFVQRDMEVSILGFEKGKTPFSDDPIVLEYGRKIDGLQGGVCGTGDNFDVTEHSAGYDVVDMEAYALALICKREEIPFVCLKYVSDGADDNAAQDWQSTLHHAAEKLREALKGANL